MKEEDLVAVIDDVLRDDDKNNDGYIDYAEFAKSLEWADARARTFFISAARTETIRSPFLSP